MWLQSLGGKVSTIDRDANLHLCDRQRAGHVEGFEALSGGEHHVRGFTNGDIRQRLSELKALGAKAHSPRRLPILPPRLSNVSSAADFSVILSASSLIFLAEMGDKSQLLAITLVHRYRAPSVIVGTFAAFALLNLLAVLVGQVLFDWVPQQAGAARLRGTFLVLWLSQRPNTSFSGAVFRTASLSTSDHRPDQVFLIKDTCDQHASDMERNQ